MRRQRKTPLARGRVALVALVALVAAGAVAGALTFGVWAQPADLVFHGGPVITLDEAKPIAEALAVRGDRIVAVGDRRDVVSLEGNGTRVVDLEGRALLPGFIDAHGHLTFVAQVVDLANLAPPPVGRVDSIGALLGELRRYSSERGLGPGDWLVGFGYDDSLIAERRHPTRDDLDAVFPDRPVALRHVSGHLMSVNTVCLELAGIDASTPDPPGGLIRRRPGSRVPNGVLEEGPAFGRVMALVPRPSAQDQLAQLRRGLAQYASYGLTTAQDGLTSRAGLDLLRRAAAQGELSMDVIVYLSADQFQPGDLEPERLGRYEGGLKVGGVKMLLDGSPQGKTAYLTRPFVVPPDGQPEGYVGYPAMPQQEVDSRVAGYLDAGIPLLAHANGDAAADQLIHAVKAAGSRRELGDHRTVMIHSQIVREDQLDDLAVLGIIPSFFVAHTFFWGDWHRDSVLGPERADFISPARSALDRGIRPTFHNDAPIVPPDVMRLVWTGVNRRTRSGDILGPLERVSVLQALRAVTLNAAYQSFEEDDKGSLEVGKLADLVILESDPLATDPATLEDIAVIETFSHGRSIYASSGNAE